MFFKKFFIGILLITTTNLFALSSSDNQTLTDNEVYMFLSAHVYELRGKTKEEAIQSDVSYGNKWANGANWQVVDYRENSDNDFNAALYYNQNELKYILSFGGTASLLDVEQDLHLVYRNISVGQYEDAKEMLEAAQVSVLSTGSVLEITGHSLGGSLAQFAGLESGKKTVTFNTAPMSLNGNVLLAMSDGGKDRLLHHYDDHITNICSANDIVSALAVLIDKVPKVAFNSDQGFISDDLGIRAINGAKTNLDMYSGHKIGEMIKKYNPVYENIFGETALETAFWNSYTLSINQSKELLVQGVNDIKTGIVVSAEAAKFAVVSSGFTAKLTYKTGEALIVKSADVFYDTFFQFGISLHQTVEIITSAIQNFDLKGLLDSTKVKTASDYINDALIFHGASSSFVDATTEFAVQDTNVLNTTNKELIDTSEGFSDDMTNLFRKSLYAPDTKSMGSILDTIASNSDDIEQLQTKINDDSLDKPFFESLTTQLATTVSGENIASGISMLPLLKRGYGAMQHLANFDSSSTKDVLISSGYLINDAYLITAGVAKAGKAFGMKFAGSAWARSLTTGALGDFNLFTAVYQIEAGLLQMYRDNSINEILKNKAMQFVSLEKQSHDDIKKIVEFLFENLNANTLDFSTMFSQTWLHINNNQNGQQMITDYQQYLNDVEILQNLFGKNSATELNKYDHLLLASFAIKDAYIREANIIINELKDLSSSGNTFGNWFVALGTFGSSGETFVKVADLAAELAQREYDMIGSIDVALAIYFFEKFNYTLYKNGKIIADAENYLYGTETEESTGSTQDTDALSIVNITLPSTATFDGNTITASSGDMIALTFNKYYHGLDQLINVGTNGYPITIQYTLENGMEGSFEATWDSNSNNLEFTVSIDVPFSIDHISYNDGNAINTLEIPTELTSDIQPNELGELVGLHIVDTFYGDETYVFDNYLYVLNGNGSRGLSIYDISDVHKMKILGSIDTNSPRDLAKVGTNVFLSDYTEGVKVIDVSNPNQPTLVNTINVGKSYDIDIVDDRYLYVACSTDGLKVFDIIDPHNPIELTIFGGFTASSMHRSENYLFLPVYSDGNTYVFNISNPASPVQVDTMSGLQGQNVVQSNGLIYTISTNTLEIFDTNDPIHLSSISQLNIVGIRDFVKSDNLLYAIDTEGLKIIDIVNPLLPTIIGEYDTYTPLDIKLSGNYVYIADEYSGIKVINIANPSQPVLSGSLLLDDAQSLFLLDHYAFVDEGGMWYVIDISNPITQNIISQFPNILYDNNYNGHNVKRNDSILALTDDDSIQLFDVSQPSSPVLLNTIHTRLDGNLYTIRSIEITDNYLYVGKGNREIMIYDISDLNAPNLLSSFDLKLADEDYFFPNDIEVGNNTLFVSDDYDGVRAFDITIPGQVSFINHISNNGTDQLLIKDNYLFTANNNGVDVINITNPASPIVTNISGLGWVEYITSLDDYVYIANDQNLTVLDISVPGSPEIISNATLFDDDRWPEKIKIFEDIAFVKHDYGYVTLFDISDPSHPRELNTIPKSIFAYEIIGDYIYLFDEYGTEDLWVLNWKNELDKFNIIQSYLSVPKPLVFNDEEPRDYTVQKSAFTKIWTYGSDLTGLSIEVLSNDYASLSTPIVNGNTVSMDLMPDISKSLNTIILQFKDANGNIVKVGNSDTFWSKTRTNTPPTLASGQLTQLVGTMNTILSLDIDTYDADNENVTLSLAEDYGPNVYITGNTLTASFTDNLSTHLINIILNDGKESVTKEIAVLQFDTDNIKTFYNDINTSHTYFNDVAFATLEGVVWGQSDPDNPGERVFKPDDNASMAEALAMVLQAGQKMNLLTLPNSQYYLQAFPSWSMPYYTFAREHGAIDTQGSDLSVVYPSREEIAKIIVKSLGLEEKMLMFEDINITFFDEANFSSNEMLRHAQITKIFGLFMTEDNVNPQAKISRGELARVIGKIFMIPDATIVANPSSVEFGESFALSLIDKKAQKISADYELIDSSSQINSNFAINLELVYPILVDSSQLNIGTNSILATLNNNGVYNILFSEYTVGFNDADYDGIQDSLDQWSTDSRYSSDVNNNGIPDILDGLYGLTSYTESDTIDFNGQQVPVLDIINEGGIVPDLDGDGVSDKYDPDIDGDGTVNIQDAFPRDKMEWQDTDYDGIGNNADTDDDDDGLSDVVELSHGLNPLDGSDADADNDDDGISNADEIAAGTDINSNPIIDGIVDKTKYFANTTGIIGVRTYDTDGTYTGSVTFTDGSTITVEGTYEILGYALTIDRLIPSSRSVLTYLDENEGVMNFNSSIDGGEESQTHFYDTSAERDATINPKINPAIILYLLN